VYRELFEAIVAESDDVVSAFVNFFEGAALVLVESDYIDPCPIGTVAREVASTSEPLRQAADAVFDSWVRSATEVLVGAGIDPPHAEDLATLFVATTEGCFVLSRTKRSPEPLRAAARLVAPLIALPSKRPHENVDVTNQCGARRVAESAEERLEGGAPRAFGVGPSAPVFSSSVTAIPKQSALNSRVAPARRVHPANRRPQGARCVRSATRSPSVRRRTRPGPSSTWGAARRNAMLKSDGCSTCHWAKDGEGGVD
jgi:hypothetical protein